MNNTTQFLKFAILFGIIFFIIHVIYLFINKNRESFTPGIRQLYRPYIRHARIFSEGFYDDKKNHVNRLFRKFGLY